MMSKSATEQVIEALKQVIVDFNRNLTEQFGDNFKALDASVKQLVEWQEQYRAQLEQLHKLYEQSVQSITNIDVAVAHVAESTSSIPQSMERLTSIIETADHQLTELERHLEAFQKMRDQAIDAVPQVQAHVEQMANDMTESVRKASEHYKTLLDVSDDYIEAQNQLTQEMLAVLTQAGQQVQNDTQTVQQQVADSIQQMQQQVQSSLNETVTALNHSIEDLHQKMEQSVEANVNAQLEALDQAMQQELQRVMQGMATALSQIAGKFTEDYRGLTESMHRIVQQGEYGQ